MFSRDVVALTEAGHIDSSRMTPFYVYVFLGQVNLSNSTGGRSEPWTEAALLAYRPPALVALEIKLVG